MIIRVSRVSGFGFRVWSLGFRVSYYYYYYYCYYYYYSSSTSSASSSYSGEYSDSSCYSDSYSCSPQMVRLTCMRLQSSCA